jgi:hypothetical protein
VIDLWMIELSPVDRREVELEVGGSVCGRMYDLHVHGNGVCTNARVWLGVSAMCSGFGVWTVSTRWFRTAKV